MPSLKERSVFVREFCSHFKDIGSVTPSSRFLARSVTEPLREFVEASPPIRVLEAGAGTGSITREIVKRLRSGDRLVAYEINERLARVIEKEVKPEAEQRGVELDVVCRPVQDVDRNERFEVIISGLPFANFAPDVVDEIFNTFFDVVIPGGTISFYGYCGVRKIRKLLSGVEDQKRLERVEKTIDAYCRENVHHRERVLLNIPPAWSRHIHVAAENGRAC